MVTVRKSKLLPTSAAIRPNTYYYEFDVDTAGELPDPYYNNTIVAHGSKATIINSGETYRINGDGEWKSQSTSGGAGLPDVTAEDNGDVLTVVDGAWSKSEPSTNLKIYSLKVDAANSRMTLDDGVTGQTLIDELSNGRDVLLGFKGTVTSPAERYMWFARLKEILYSDIVFENITADDTTGELCCTQLFFHSSQSYTYKINNFKYAVKT